MWFIKKISNLKGRRLITQTRELNIISLWKKVVKFIELTRIATHGVAVENKTV